jgi:ABC-type branched-subunit amino acid transport system ATPase component
MLSVDGLTKMFGGFIAVNRVCLELKQGEILGLIGPNGSGKSTTFGLIAGALAPSAGSIPSSGADRATTIRSPQHRAPSDPSPFRRHHPGERRACSHDQTQRQMREAGKPGSSSW